MTIHTNHHIQTAKAVFLFTVKTSEEKTVDQGLPLSIRKINVLAVALSHMKLSDSPEEKEAQIRQTRAAFPAARYTNVINKELPQETKRVIKSKIVEL